MYFVKQCKVLSLAILLMGLFFCTVALPAWAQQQERYVPPGLFAGLGIDSVRVYPEDTCEGLHPW